MALAAGLGDRRAGAPAVRPRSHRVSALRRRPHALDGPARSRRDAGAAVAGRAWIARDPEDLPAALRLLERLPAQALTYGRLNDAVAALSAMEPETRSD
jgi:hypothetical protein